MNYFSHDSNAQNDPKIVALRFKHKWAGYGLYWAIIERLRESTDYKLPAEYDLLAWDFRVDTSLLKSVICDFGLFAFTVNGECFYSESLLKRMELKDDKSEKARAAALKRWEINSKCNADAMQTQTECNASKINKRKDLKENSTDVELKKNDNRFSPPTLSEIDFFIKGQGFKIDPETFFNYYQSKGWKVGSTKMKDWKAAVRNWAKRENEFKPARSPAISLQKNIFECAENLIKNNPFELQP